MLTVLITGQDGSYLAKLLLSKGYRVIGRMRRSDVVTFECTQHIQDSRFYRPAQVDYLVADFTKVRHKLDWDPKVDFDGLVRKMVDADLVSMGKEIS